MSSIDERIVNMKFNNGQFQQGVKQTQDSLKKLKDGLNMENARKGLDFLSNIGKNFTLSGMIENIKSAGARFVALGAIGVAALTNITNRAINAGATMLKSLTLDPILQGFQEYELKMGSIQTILANTQRFGTTLDDVSMSLDALNEYADKTIYNFGDMTRNIGLFTNAGIDIADATSMIQGFSNAAAASGTSAEGAAGAAYQLSQALSTGTIRLMDWRSLTNVGMGNKNMQDSLIQIADAMGMFNSETTTASAASKDFNGSLESNWLSADVMSNYLKIMAGDMDAAAMSALGLSDDVIASLQQQQVTAEEAATKVRTWTQLIGTLQEAVGSSWSETFEILFGDFEEATELFTAASDTLGALIGKAGDDRNGLLQGWSDLGGRTIAISAISNAFSALMSVLTPVGQAFRDIFPPITAQRLVTITANVRDFFASLKLGEQSSENLRRTFAGVFAVFDILGMVLGEVVGLVTGLFGEVFKGSGSFLELTGNIGDFLVSVRDAIKQGNGLADVFDKIGAVLANPIKLIRELGQSIIDGAGEMQSFGDIWDRVVEIFGKIKEKLQPAIDWVKGAFEDVKEAVGKLNIDPALILGGVGAGSLVGILFTLRNALKGIPDMLMGLVGGAGGGIVDTIKDIFGSVTDTLGAMQDKLRSETLIRIGIALGILTAAVIALSFVDPVKLATSLGAMTVMFTQLSLVLLAVEKISKTGALTKMPIIAVGLILLATAMVILSAAVLMLSELSWEELAVGLSGMAVGLGLLVGASKILSKNTGSMIGASIGILAMSGAMLLMAEALEQFAQLDWDEIARGSAAVGGMVAVMIVLSKAMSGLKGLVGGAIGMVIISGAMLVLAEAIERFSDFSWPEIGKGLATMAGALLIIAGAMAIMTGGILGAAALVIISAALVILADALESFGGMSWEEIGKSMAVLAGSLLILAGGLYLMTGAIPGALALIVVAGALSILVPILITLGGLSWETIGMGLGALAAALGVLALAGLLMTPVVPTLLLLGAAIALIGVGIGAIGLGVMLFAQGLVLLAGAGTAAADMITLFGNAIIDLIPTAMTALGEGIQSFLGVIADSAPQFFAAMVTLITSLLDAIDTVSPKIIDTIMKLINNLLNALQKNVPQFVTKGTNIILGLLNGLEKSLPKIITKGADVAIKFIEGIGQNTLRIANAGMDMVIDLVNGIADSIRNNTARMNAAGRNLASAIIEGMTSGIRNGISSVTSAARDIASSALSAAKGFLGINSPSKEFYKIGAWSVEGFTNAMNANADRAGASGANMGAQAVNGIKKSIADISSLAVDKIDVDPTIRPVLDLSQVERESGRLGGILSAQANASTSFNKAAAIAADNRKNEEALSEETFEQAGTTNVSYTQNNYSPKALPTRDIYRGTNNQISKIKEGLKK